MLASLSSAAFLIACALSAGEAAILALHRIVRRTAAENDDPVAKRRRLTGFERQRQFGLFLIEHLTSERIRGEQAIAACVPIRRKARIRWVIEHQQGHLFAIDGSIQRDPSSARAPDGVAFQSLAAR